MELRLQGHQVPLDLPSPLSTLLPVNQEMHILVLLSSCVILEKLCASGIHFWRRRRWVSMPVSSGPQAQMSWESPKTSQSPSQSFWVWRQGWKLEERALLWSSQACAAEVHWLSFWELLLLVCLRSCGTYTLQIMSSQSWWPTHCLLLFWVCRATQFYVLFCIMVTIGVFWEGCIIIPVALAISQPLSKGSLSNTNKIIQNICFW